MTLTQTLDHYWYESYQDEWDALAFRRRILEVIQPTDRVLDMGAGRGATPHMNFHGLAKEIVGTDIDPAVLSNPQLDRAIHTPNGRLTELGDATFDLIISKDVLEHVERPDAFFAEISRLLRPGGAFLGKTPGGLHYVTLIARVTPLWFHKAFNERRGIHSADTFPTFYRANTAAALRRLARRAGLEVVSIELDEGRPEYLRFSPITYFAGMLYERVVNKLHLNFMKAVVYVRLRKPSNWRSRYASAA